MYCKNCGKKLPDGARFCDRCNMSVRKKEDKMDLIVELKEERLARKKEKDVKERYKKIQGQKRKRRSKVYLAAAAIAAVGVISAFVSYQMIKSGNDFNQAINTYIEQTEPPVATELATAQVVGGELSTEQPMVTATSGTSAVSVNDDGYVETQIGGLNFAYPRGFEKKETESNEILHLKDSTGGADITANRETTNSPAQELMKSYADKVGGTVVASRAGETWYSITLSKDSQMYHRKGIVNNGILTYYQMVYPAASEKEGEYTENIEYMDEFFKGE